MSLFLYRHIFLFINYFLLSFLITILYCYFASLTSEDRTILIYKLGVIQWQHVRASPTVLQISFAFMYLRKSLKNTYPTVWHLDFAILLTWQKEMKNWHICQTCSHLALEKWREVINAKPLEIVSFHLCHIFLRLGKLSHLPN